MLQANVFSNNTIGRPGMVAYTCNPRTWEENWLSLTWQQSNSNSLFSTMMWHFVSTSLQDRFYVQESPNTSQTPCVWFGFGLVLVWFSSFSRQGFQCNNSFGSPGTYSVNQAGLKLTEIHLPLPPECWVKGICPDAQSWMYLTTEWESEVVNNSKEIVFSRHNKAGGPMNPQSLRQHA